MFHNSGNKGVVITKSVLFAFETTGGPVRRRRSLERENVPLVTMAAVFPPRLYLLMPSLAVGILYIVNLFVPIRYPQYWGVLFWQHKRI